jgi:hypothetical protein
MNFVPSGSIAASIITALMLPPVLATLSHGPWKIAAPGRRFAIAAALCVTGWGISLALLDEVALADATAGALILLAAVLAEFTLWTLVAWGFTVSLLAAVARADRELTLDEWAVEYAGGRPIQALARDRLGVLVRFGLATWTNGRAVATKGAGVRTARLVGCLRTLFGLST